MPTQNSVDYDAMGLPVTVERILLAKQRDAGADVSALAREIDELVYALYDLTDEEKALVQATAN